MTTAVPFEERVKWALEEAGLAGAAPMPDADDVFADDKPVAERETAAPWWTPGPAFAEHANKPAAPMLVDRLLPGEGITVPHGHPRTFKSWISLDVGISVGSGARCMSNLHVPEPATVLYISNEDSPRQTAARALKLARGKGLDGLPDRLLFAVHAGIWLDDEPGQTAVIHLCKREGVRLVILDPLRSLTSAVDQGPRELQPFARFLRLLIESSGCTVLAPHHDVKPAVGVTDNRGRAHRASGGGLFSIADAPIHAERVGDEPTVLLYPSAWKHSDTPGPLEVQLTVSDDVAVLEAKATTETSAADHDPHRKVRDYLTAHPDASGNQIAQGTRTRREVVSRALEDMAAAGEVDSHPGPRRATCWFLAATDGRECFPASGGDDAVEQ